MRTGLEKRGEGGGGGGCGFRRLGPLRHRTTTNCPVTTNGSDMNWGESTRNSWAEAILIGTLRRRRNRTTKLAQAEAKDEDVGGE